MNTVLVLAVALFALTVLGPLTGRYQLLTVRTGSMAPAVPAGSVVVAVPMARRDVQVGDVITFHPPDEPSTLRTHRVVEVVTPGDQPVVRTKGDANADVDPGLVRLTGGPAWRTVVALPWAGRAVAAGRAALALVLVPLLAAAALWSIWARRLPAHAIAR